MLYNQTLFIVTALGWVCDQLCFAAKQMQKIQKSAFICNFVDEHPVIWTNEIENAVVKLKICFSKEFILI